MADQKRCSFCGHTKADGRDVIAGPNVDICSDCVTLCNQILGAREEQAESGEAHQLEPTAAEGSCRALVGIIMGSDSDAGVMKDAAAALQELGVSYEATVASAHRTPERAAEWAKTAAARGIKVIIAGAGQAAHLPGVLAAFTTLPIIGVPINASPLQGVDALYAIVQMPPGIPVATVGINNARNAGLLAAEILALGDADLAQRLQALRAKMAEKVIEKAQKVEQELS